MGEYCCSMEEDWDLQAIVRGCTHDQYTTNYSSLLDYNYHDDDDDHYYDFQELDKNDYSLIVNELDDLYKPFYDSKICTFSPQLDHSDSPAEKKQVKFEQEDVKKVLDHKETAVVATPTSVTPATKYKRKNQQKRVVVQVTAEGLSSDKWAWRKYGQKPIKGSPYPRSYYRCSSSKGCLARKQVEESCSDPGMFIITYSAEHNHSQPTRRSSLAGTNRQKSSALKRTTSGESCVSSSSTTKEHLNSSKVNAGEVQAYKKIKHEKYDHRIIETHEQYSMDQDIDDREFVIPDSILTDDFHKVLEDLDGLISNSSLYSCASQ